MIPQNMLPTYEVKLVFFERKIGFDDSVNETECLQQIITLDLLRMYAQCSELPYNICTLV